MAYPVSYFYFVALLSMVVLTTLAAVSFPRTRYHNLTLLDFSLVTLWILDDLLSNLAESPAVLKIIAYALAPSWGLLPYILLITTLVYTGYPKWLANIKGAIILALGPISVLTLVFSGQLYTGFHPASVNGQFFHSEVSMWQVLVNAYIAVYLVAAALIVLVSARKTSSERVLQTAKVLGFSLGPAGFFALLNNTILTPLGVMMPFVGAEMVAFATWILGLGMMRHDYFAPIDLVMAERDQAQGALRFRERILSMMPIGAALFVPGTNSSEGQKQVGKIVYANKLFLQLSQMSSQDETFSQEILHSLELMQKNNPELIAPQELEIADAQGQTRSVLLSKARIGDDMLLLGLQDLTSVKQAQAEFRKHQAKLMEAQKMEAIGRLSAGIAHDFNNQLLSMIGIVSSVEVDENAPYAHELQEILRAVDRARALVRQLQLDKLGDALQADPISLNEILGQLRPVLQKSLAANQKLDLRLPRAEAWIRFNPLHLEQLLMTLTSNAKDAMQAGGTLHIDFEADAQKISLIVRDEGQGIAPEQLQKIFQPLFSTKGEQGTGLGLAMVKRLMEESGADIEVSSTLQEGSSFRLIFAREQAPDTENKDALADSEKNDKIVLFSKKSNKLQGVKILLVDNNNAVLRAVAKMLQSQGAELNTAGSAQEVLSQTWPAGLPFDLLLSDVDMPQVSGIELAYALRGIVPDLPIILMSGYQERPQEIEDLHLRFISKPFLPDELFAEIQDVLGLHHPLGKDQPDIAGASS